MTSLERQRQTVACGCKASFTLVGAGGCGEHGDRRGWP